MIIQRLACDTLRGILISCVVKATHANHTDPGSSLIVYRQISAQGGEKTVPKNRPRQISREEHVFRDIIISALVMCVISYNMGVAW